MDNGNRSQIPITILMIIFSITAIVLTYCNWNILRVIRRHRRRITSAERCRDEQHSRFQRDTKKYRLVVTSVMLFIVCKTPSFILILVVFIAKCLPWTWTLRILFHFSNNLLLLNSVLNPLLFCFRVTIFRNAVKELFCY